MIDRKALKLVAKMQMSQSAPSYLAVMLLWVLTAVLIPQVALSVVTGPMTDSLEGFTELIYGGIDVDVALRLLQLSSGQLFLNMALNVVLSIYQMVLSFGLALYCLRLHRGDPCGPADLFGGFSIAGRVIGAGLLVSLITLAWAFLLAFPLIAVITVPIVLEMSRALIILIALAAVVGYVAALYAIVLRYSLTTFALADRPELGAMGAIQHSKNLMRGHKWQYFVLGLSFFGWALLCSLPVGIFGGISSGLSTSGSFLLPAWADGIISVVLMLPYYLWLTPYIQTTTAGFYDSLHNQGFQPLDPGAAAWPR